jgi:N-glycosylase/DNA lyase
MTPQTSAENAEKAVSTLREQSFATLSFDPEPILANRTHYIRFHKTKARHLLLVKQMMPRILERLSNGNSSFDQREWLVNNVKGLGYKEATHFLRNIGKNDGLAILDRHILRNLKRYGVIRALPRSLSRKQYLAIERRFKRFSDKLGIPVDELDLLFWSLETGNIRK